MSKIYTCIIIDDEQPARLLIENYIEKIPFLKLIGSFKNPIAALEIIQNEILI